MLPSKAKEYTNWYRKVDFNRSSPQMRGGGFPPFLREDGGVDSKTPIFPSRCNPIIQLDSNENIPPNLYYNYNSPLHLPFSRPST